MTDADLHRPDPRASRPIRPVGRVGDRGGHPPPRDDRRPRRYLDLLQHDLGWDVPHPAQPLEPLGPERPVAIMATGMVLIIVSRNIDLSVGSMLGFLGYTMAMLQAVWIPTTLGLGFDQPYTWILDGDRRGPAGGAHRRLAGFPRRLWRRPVIHRHARRPARLAWLPIFRSSKARPSRLSTRSSYCSAAAQRARWGRPRAGSSGSSSAWGSSTRSGRVTKTASLRVPRPADVGGDPDRRRWLRARSGRSM